MLRKKEDSAAGAAGEPPSPPATAAPPEAVAELVSSLERRRAHREATLALRSGLRDAAADFSFLRIKGLRNLLKYLRSVAASDDAIRLFRHSQSLPDLQVIPVLFKSSLRQIKDDLVVNLDHIFGVEPMKITSPATDSEIALALRVLEGCCLLHRECASLAHQHNAVKVLLHILSTRSALEQGACLDALISLMLDSTTNQMDFEACHGVKKIAQLMKDEQGNENIRVKCGEFLLLLIGHVHGREGGPLVTINDDVRRLLGEKSASLVWAASQFGSTLEPDQRQTALQIQARRVLESLELY